MLTASRLGLARIKAFGIEGSRFKLPYTGAGAEMRHAMGVAVFSGMLGVTFFGLFLTPVFYVLLREMEKRVARGSVAGGSQSNTAAHYLVAGERHQSSA
jgi:AcrB/AcrD/AcrF family